MKPRKLPACGRFLSSALISRIKLTVNVRSGPELEYTQIRGAWRHNAGMATVVADVSASEFLGDCQAAPEPCKEKILAYVKFSWQMAS